jgi:hypothetical protein
MDVKIILDGSFEGDENGLFQNYLPKESFGKMHSKMDLKRSSNINIINQTQFH